MKKYVVVFIILLAISFIIKKCNHKGEVAEIAPFEYESFETFKVLGSYTTIQFLDSSRLWIANINNNMQSGNTDGNWSWVNKDSLIIKITLKSGINDDYAGIYKFSKDYGCLARKKCGKNFTQFCKKGGGGEGLENWSDELD